MKSQPLSMLIVCVAVMATIATANATYAQDRIAAATDQAATGTDNVVEPKEAAFTAAAADGAASGPKVAPSTLPHEGPKPVVSELRIFKRRKLTSGDVHRFRVTPEIVSSIQEKAIADGEIDENMSFAERAPVITRYLAMLPENKAAYEDMMKPGKTPEEKTASMSKLNAIVLAVMRMLELLEDIFGSVSMIHPQLLQEQGPQLSHHFDSVIALAA